MSAHNTYTMVLAFTPSLRRILLLHKPPDHRNPIFRDRWTVPGGLLEDSESTADGAAREFREETGLHIEASQLTPIGLFFCNCDPQESEHDIAVHAVILSDDFLAQAQGSSQPQTERTPPWTLHDRACNPWIRSEAIPILPIFAG